MSCEHARDPRECARCVAPERVWIVGGSSRYHRIQGCAALDEDDQPRARGERLHVIRRVPVALLIGRAYAPCHRCGPSEAMLTAASVGVIHA